MPTPPSTPQAVGLVAKRLAVAALDALPTPVERLAGRVNHAVIEPLSVGVVHVGWAPDRARSSLAALQQTLDRWTRHHVLVWCDVRNGGVTAGSEAPPPMLTVAGSNEEREFSGIQAGIAALTKADLRPDVWIFANDRWDVDIHPALRRPHPALANIAAAAGGMIGRVDRFPHLVTLHDAMFRWWVRSNLMVLSQSVVNDIAIVGCTRSAFDHSYPDVWPGSEWVPPKLDPAYWSLLLEWLTGGPGPLARSWYQHQAATNETWPALRPKLLSVLNEHLLSVACLDSGHPLIDIATGDRLARLGYQTPAVAACLSDMNFAGGSRRPSTLTPPARTRLAARCLAGSARGAAPSPVDTSPRRGRAAAPTAAAPGAARPRLTILSPFAPDPAATHAGGQYLASYCAEASKYADVVVVAPTPDKLLAGLLSPKDYGIEFVDIRVPRMLALAPLARARNALAGLTPGPGVVRAFRSNPTVRHLVDEADIVEVQFTHFLPVAAALLPPSTSAVVCAFAHDVVTQSLSRQTTTTESVVWRVGARIATAVAAHKEARLLNRTNLVCVFSSKDEALLRELDVSVPVQILSPNIDVPEAMAEHLGPPVVLFCGAMFRRVNYHAVDEFLRTGWPKVRASVPAARFVVAGSEPPPLLASDPAAGVEVTGFVEDLGDVYRNASCFVAPLTAGAGVKFKVVQAMAFGLPVVGTPVAFEGLPGAPGEVVMSSREAADRLITLLQDRESRLRLGVAGRTYVNARFDFAGSVEDLHAEYRRLLRAASR